MASIPVDPSRVGLMIGKGGANIKALKEPVFVVRSGGVFEEHQPCVCLVADFLRRHCLRNVACSLDSDSRSKLDEERPCKSISRNQRCYIIVCSLESMTSNDGLPSRRAWTSGKTPARILGPSAGPNRTRASWDQSKVAR